MKLKKKIVLLALVSVLLSTTVIVRSISPIASYPAEAELLMEVDLPVHNIDSGKNFSTIQGAINDNETLNGHTIVVDAGSYYEHVVVNKSLSLIGENKYNTVIDGNSTGNVIEVTSNNVNFTGFTIQHGDNGIYVGDGIFLSFCNIYGNIVRNNTNGIYLTGSSSNNNVSYNIITNNRHGIVLSYSGKNTLLGNNATNNRYNFEVKGFTFSHLNNYLDTSNTVDGKPIYYLIDVNNAIFGAESNAGTVFLINCQNITVKDLTLTKNGAGVFLWNTTNSKIENVTVTRSHYGVFLGDSCNNTLSANTVANCTYGISLEASFWQSNNNTIIGNNVISNSRGIDLDTSNNNIITDNIVTDNSNGIYLWDSSNNILFGNIVSSSKYGIELWAYGSYGNILSGNVVSLSGVDGIVLNGANNNTLSGNIVSSNGQYGITLMADNNIIYGNILINNSGSYWSSGIYFGWTRNNIISSNAIKNNSRGIFLYGEGDNNQIFHNNFINNTHQVVSSEEHSNIWDNGYPSGGNYWSDYTGVDANMDGIGDSSYEIDSMNIDHYPLMGAFSDFSVTLEEETHHVTTVCNSTISAFEFDQVNRIIRFNVTGEEDIGFCRVCIPHDLMEPPYIVTVDGLAPLYANYTLYDNGIHTWIYFTYLHSEHEVAIIPEFPTWTSMLLIFTVLTVAIVIYKRRLLKTPIP